MADNHWINADGGNWSTVGNWSLGHVPDATEHALFDCAFNAGKTVTIDATAICLNMDWTGATNTPTLAISGYPGLQPYGNVTFISAMSFTAGNYFYPRGSTPQLIIVPGGSLPFEIIFNSQGSTITLQSSISCNSFRVQAGTCVLNSGITLNISGALGFSYGAAAKTVTLNDAILNCTSVSYDAAVITLTANTSTINCSGNFAGGGITTYNIVNLTGAAPTISGNNTFNELHLHPTAAQTVKFTDGSNNTVTALTRENNLNRIILRGTAVAGWTITKAGGGTNTIHFVDVQQSTGAPANSFYVGSSGTLTGCTNWAYYPITISPAGGSFIL